MPTTTIIVAPTHSSIHAQETYAPRPGEAQYRECDGEATDVMDDNAKREIDATAPGFTGHLRRTMVRRVHPFPR